MFAYSWPYRRPETGQKADLSWDDAACRDGSGSLTALFFSDEEADINLAKTLCAGCHLAPECLRGALERREPMGVWGGQLFVDGAVVPRKRKRGRPPKVAGPLVAEPVRHLAQLDGRGEDRARRSA